jgi:predicted metal-dependent phosphoesterase TrpH
MKWPKVNAHLHTLYSFSAFESIPQALDMAVAEGVKVVGINDFYTTAGYPEWQKECAARSLYPLYNIEFISLQQDDQKAGIRVNDPNNPGRTYLSGKGLACPPSLPEPYASQLAGVVKESNLQVKAMCAKLNELLESIGANFRLDFGKIEKELTRGNVRERHLAKALRMEVYASCDAPAAMFEKIFGGKELKSGLDDFAGVENEIRGNLLKAGGAAFVPEDPKAFLPMDDVRRIILAAGGIPTYPFLADDAKGGFTDFEGDLAQAAATLKARGIHSVEFITTRNSVEVLEKYCEYLWNEGFVVTLGTEHNTPAMEPIELFARGGTPLTDKLMEINYKGACVVAAHQARYASTKMAYDPARREEYVAESNKLIKAVV